LSELTGLLRWVAVVVVEISDRRGEHQRLELELSEISIGRTADHNHVTLPRGNVSKRHARLVIRDDKLIIVDLKSTNGTFVNGRRIASPLVLQESDEVTIGDFALRFRIATSPIEDEDTLEVDATELRLLAGIAQQEDGARMVYADWLETHDDPVRAEFLRLQEEVVGLADGERFHWIAERMRALAEHIALDWRSKVARPLIENCLAIEVECPREWGALAPTERAGVRYCDGCKQRVYYCATVADARRHAFAGSCVAVDVVAIRRPGDLQAERPVRMGRMMPYRGG